MAPIAATVALSHVDGVSDSARARELYKYYQPTAPINQEACFPSTATPSSAGHSDDGETRDINVKSSVTSSKISSPDTALTAFCQLVTWRIGAQRAMISLIDADTQYFIAESTKTVDLVNNTKFDPGDELWMGCGSVTKAGRLCERTIAVTPTKQGEYPCFIVNDLREDERFNQLGFVTESPFLKFYAGVPLITKRGIPIGSLFVVDDRVWSGLSKEKVNFMGTLAETIMRHLEMVREVEEHRRGMKMSRGLASFVEGRAQLVEAEVEAEDGEGTKVAGEFATEENVTRAKSKGSTRESIKSRGGSVASVERKEREYSAALAKSEEAIIELASHHETESRPDLELISQPTSFGGASVSVTSPNETSEIPGVSPSEDMSEGATLKTLFSRAANLIREAFEVDGGVVFYDAQRGFGTNLHRKTKSLSKVFHDDTGVDTSGDDLYSPGDQALDRKEEISSSPSTSFTSGSVSPNMGEGTFTRSSMFSKTALEVLGFSTAGASSIHGDELPGPQHLRPFDEKALNTLLKRYPRGKLWTFDSDGSVSSSSEDDAFKPYSSDPTVRSREMQRRNARSEKNKLDAKYLATHFPGVRQLLFVPLWDAGRSRWLSGCFAWSTEPTRVLSKQSELAFLSAFGNSVMAECSRIDTEIADQKKGDFIGSISHELRSPLHGILASAEFLSEENLNSFEKGLVETIDSCGRTLLDTINHILDFSKINQFEKVWRRTKRGGSRSGPHGDGVSSLRKSDLPMVNLYAEVDVSVVCEEVVEGVFAGHVFQNLTAGSFDMVAAPRGKMSDPKQIAASTEPNVGEGILQPPQVQVIFDVNIQSYNFITQPGAFRRVIMNLLGNALKYTSHGYVYMKLEAVPMEALLTPTTGELAARSLITITIRDTGRGIASEFLRSKVFTPFAQENSLSSGTGLGLSIVRSIVALLEGEINIDSEVGRGTEVRVTLPLLHDMPKTADSASTNPKSVTSSASRESDEAIQVLRSKVLGRKVALHGFDIESQDPVISELYRLLRQSITNFLTQWYGLQVVPLGSRTNLIISNEANPAAVSKLARQAASTHRNTPAILVLCAQSSRFDRNISPFDSKCKVGYVAKPVGPLKLAKAITQCLEGVHTLSTPNPADGNVLSPGSNDLSSVFEELSVSAHGGELLDNSRMATDSNNARKAIESPTPNASTDKSAEFPFPVADDRPVFDSKSASMPSVKDLLNLNITSNQAPPASQTLTSMEKSASLIPSSTIPDRHYAPSLLLVDDNKINLKLLSTYMQKKQYQTVHLAENGLEAVTKVKERAEGYDIIFMDISMPILDGFGATKQIRAIERSRRLRAADEPSTSTTITQSTAKTKEDTAPKDQPSHNKTPSLIIALTGLASGRDQQEAASVGVDIFLTKPVSFKEVGKLLDNWEANREKDVKDGSLTSGDGGEIKVG